MPQARATRRIWFAPSYRPKLATPIPRAQIRSQSDASKFTILPPIFVYA